MLVETQLGRLFLEVSGEGPELVLWHSLLCDGGMWRHQVAALEQHYRIVNIDAPGHGRSGPVRRRYTMDECVQVSVGLLDELGIERAVWCGLSWGGMVGMRLASRFPERLAGLVLMDTSARSEDRLKKPAYRVLAAMARRFGPSRTLAKIVVPIFFADRTRRERPDLVEDFIQRLVRMDSESLQHAVDAVIFQRDDVSAELGHVDQPTLVMVGSEDRATPPGQAEHIARVLPSAELVRIPGAGHLSALEQPERVNAVLEPFLARVTAESRA